MATYNAIKYNVDYGGFAGSLMPLSTFTSDGSDATATFTSGIDSTYNEYLFIYNNIQRITDNVGNGNDECCSGLFRLYSPSSTTFVKHFMGVSNTYQNSDYSVNAFVGGYANTTSAIDGVQFKFASGEIQGGTIQMFGII